MYMYVCCTNNEKRALFLTPCPLACLVYLISLAACEKQKAASEAQAVASAAGAQSASQAVAAAARDFASLRDDNSSLSQTLTTVRAGAAAARDRGQEVAAVAVVSASAAGDATALAGPGEAGSLRATRTQLAEVVRAAFAHKLPPLPLPLLRFNPPPA
jgi:hypothetical protein